MKTRDVGITTKRIGEVFAIIFYIVCTCFCQFCENMVLFYKLVTMFYACFEFF